MPIYKNFHLKNLCYYKTGGFCKKLYQPQNEKELEEALKEIHKNGEKFFILGAGSNSLVSDEVWDGSVLNLAEMKKLELKDDCEIIAEGGVTNFALSEFALEKGLGDAAWMYGLPGSLGATVRMNARCYGGEISQIVTRIVSFDQKGIKKIYINTRHEKNIFSGYKDTIFMKNNEIISEVTVHLKPAKRANLKEKMMSYYEDRKSKDQYEWPSCGCVFKNDYRKEVSVPSGLLIDSCGLKGSFVGGAVLSEKHANFIQNRGATSRDILELSLLIREKVWKDLGIWLEYEMEALGHFPQDLEQKMRERRVENFNQKKIAELQAKFQKKI